MTFTTLEEKVRNEQRELPNHEVGQIVPVLEHSNCVGLRGVVQTNNDILCEKCNRPIYPDNEQAQQEASTLQSP